MRATVVLAIIVSAPAAAAELTFSDQTVAAGLGFSHGVALDHRAGPMCSGGAVGDFNGDGYPDLYIVGAGEGDRDAVFINETDGTFSNRWLEWQVATRHRGVAATVADFDDDGDDDVYVTSFGPTIYIDSGGYHRLLRNDGGRFSETAAAAGVNMTTDYPDGYGAAFGDYDRDGDLDLFVGGWHGVNALGARLFRNDGGSFVNVTDAAGVISHDTHAFGAVWSDMDGDRYPELIVAGDFGTSRYYRNNRDGTFSELDPGTGAVVEPVPGNWSIGKAHNAMGITAGDVNRDGLADFFITAIWPTFAFASEFWGNGLYINHGGHVFSETAESAGVHDGGWGWGTSAVDLDNDGWTDLPMTNGWQQVDPITNTDFTEDPTFVFRNGGGAVFSDVATAAGLAHTGQGRTLLHLDYDRDGDMDIVILSNGQTLRLFRNDLIVGETPDDAHWLQLKLDTSGNPQLAPHGAGALITVETASGTQTQQVVMGGTYLGQSELVAHFGLGSDAKVNALTVDWGNGKLTRLKGVRADQRLTLRAPCPPRPAGKPLRPRPPGGPPDNCSVSGSRP